MLAGYLASRDLTDIEEQITSAYVSNPWAGDLVLGHLIVMAELGLGTPVPERLFMTFLETAAMNSQFPEAEAVLLTDSWCREPPV